MIDLATLSPDAKEARKKRLEDKAALTARISETQRYVSFGLLVLYYALHTATDDYSKAVVAGSSSMLNLMAFAALVSVVFDYLQYYFGARSVQHALDETQDQLYDQTRIDFKLRALFYNAKQMLTFVAVILLLVVMGRSL